MNIILKPLSIAALLIASNVASAAELSDALYGLDDLAARISQDRASLVVRHGGEETTILRHPDPANTIAASYVVTLYGGTQARDTLDLTTVAALK